MGVDYSGHYGIGIKIKSVDFEDENLDSEIAELEAMCELLDVKLIDDRYGWFEVGSGSYTGEENDYYIEVLDPFDNGFAALEQKKDKLLEYIKSIGLEIDGEFGLIGGIEVW